MAIALAQGGRSAVLCCPRRRGHSSKTQKCGCVFVGRIRPKPRGRKAEDQSELQSRDWGAWVMK